MTLVLQPDTEIVTRRCTLEPLLASHAPELFVGLQDPSLYTYLPGVPPSSLGELQARFQKLETRKSPNQRQLWLGWAVRETKGGHCIGRLEATLSREEGAQIAYFVFAEHQRQGYASETCAAMLHYLFGAYPLSKAALLCDTRNQASIALAERLGFAKKERIADADFFKGASSDEFLYELCAPCEKDVARV